ncbi:MAG TPA: TusE/DsrC/DsvC family sulfur relay protein [Actinophytocola sp.]|jgi:tRNA 2-thiouridine synthesizing protein E|nr:TusE/DsrC/DsvC family sulfur relay protein [Actinophytocola sp.]
MSKKGYAGTEVSLTADGFFADPAQWRAEMATQIAREEGIAELTERHWQVIAFMRREFLDRGDGPTVLALSKRSGIGVAELYRLFPSGPARVAARIAGIPRPRGCI